MALKLQRLTNNNINIVRNVIRKVGETGVFIGFNIIEGVAIWARLTGFEVYNSNSKCIQ